MREYELTVVYDLAVQEVGGPEASVELLTNVIEARGGKLLKVDHWGRRRMAYPINRVIDADYIVTRVEFEPNAVAPLEATLGIDERIYRHLIVRADELPLPLPPREPRQQPGFVAQAPIATPAEATAGEPETGSEAVPIEAAAAEPPAEATAAAVEAPEAPVAEPAVETPAVAVEAPIAEPVVEAPVGAKAPVSAKAPVGARARVVAKAPAVAEPEVVADEPAAAAPADTEADPKA